MSKACNNLMYFKLIDDMFFPYDSLLLLLYDEYLYKYYY